MLCEVPLTKEQQDFAAAKSALEEEMEAAEHAIASIRARSDPDALQQSIRAAIAEALKTFESSDATLEAKNAAFRSIIDRCTYDKEQNLLTITYRASI